MNWTYLRAELERIIVYLVLALAAKGGYHTVAPAPPAVIVQPPSPPELPPSPPRPQPPPPPPAPAPRVDPVEATARYRASGVGCTCTIIGPSPEPGIQVVLCAAHCTSRIGDQVQVELKSGKKYVAHVYRRDTKADLSLLIIKTTDQLPYAQVAKVAPERGTELWHRGYGVDKPGNLEKGTILDPGSSTRQCTMRISFSSGDSGCGIFRTDTGQLVSVCCCTSGGYSYGASVEQIRAFLSQPREQRM